jgi:hypothetical protein
VLPDKPLPAAAADVERAVRDDLAACRLSIHLIGAPYSLVPEGAPRSLIEIQNELAVERAAAGPFGRIVWIPPGLAPSDDRQRRVIEALRTDARQKQGVDILETTFEDLRTQVTAWLTRAEAPAPGPGDTRPVYLIYEPRDVDAIAPWVDFLFTDFDVRRSVFDRDETANREHHQASLRDAEAVVIFYGAGNESWLRRKLGDVQKSAGYGRTKPPPPVAVVLLPPRTSEKEQYRNAGADLIPQWDGLTPDAWTAFLVKVRGG